MISVLVDSYDLKKLVAVLRTEENGKLLRRDLAKNIRRALAPAVREAKAGIMAMASAGIPAEGEPLRAAIARQVKAEARLSGRSAGARVKAKKRGMPRGFVNAPKRTNRAKGWRHPVHGRDVWVHQIGRPDWFDGPMQRNKGEYRRAVIHAMGETARRISRRV
jgi:hypothetical protein